MNDAKKADKGFHKVKYIINKNLVKLEFYHTNYNPGTLIRNAISGVKHKEYHVGSRDEDLFFKVTNSVGSKESSEPLTLFYDSPEQWERHFKCDCSKEIKEKWQKKHDKEWFNRK